MLKEFIPEHWRKRVYLVFALVGLTLTSFQVGFAAADVGQPLWLTVAFAVFGLWASAVGFTALANTGPAKLEIPDGDGKYRANT